MSNNNLVPLAKVRLMQVPWILGIALVAMGLYMAIGGFFIGGSYLSHSMQTPGTVVELQDDRPIVSYMVGGASFQQTLNDHGPQFQIGQTINLCFSSANPGGAQSCSDRTFSVYGSVTGIGLIVVGLALAVWAYIRRYFVSRIVRLDHVVDADIIGARPNKYVHVGKKILWYITCTWDERDLGRQFSFVSQGVWAIEDPCGILRASGIETLPVFIDPEVPDKQYYVDTSAFDRLKSNAI